MRGVLERTDVMSDWLCLTFLSFDLLLQGVDHSDEGFVVGCLHVLPYAASGPENSMSSTGLGRVLRGYQNSHRHHLSSDADSDLGNLNVYLTLTSCTDMRSPNRGRGRVTTVTARL
jgi:hypothetical protein